MTDAAIAGLGRRGLWPQRLGRGAGHTDLEIRQSGAEPRHLCFTPVGSVRANLETLAEVVPGGTPAPMPTGEIGATVGAFEAIAEAAKSDRRIKEA